MPRIATGLAALAVSLLFMPAASAAPADQASAANPRVVFFKDSGKKPIRRHDYGFLPGYRPPEVIERQRERAYWASGPHYYGPAWPRFYGNRWNGGSFGPCYTYTPIGYIWNCGK